MLNVTSEAVEFCLLVFISNPKNVGDVGLMLSELNTDFLESGRNVSCPGDRERVAQRPVGF